MRHERTLRNCGMRTVHKRNGVARDGLLGFRVRPHGCQITTAFITLLESSTATNQTSHSFTCFASESHNNLGKHFGLHRHAAERGSGRDATRHLLTARLFATAGDGRDCDGGIESSTAYGYKACIKPERRTDGGWTCDGEV